MHCHTTSTQVIVGLVQANAELELDLFPAHVCTGPCQFLCKVTEHSAHWFACKKIF